MGIRKPVWHVLDRISENLYILSRTQNSHVRYAPLYIHSFVLCVSRKILDATQFNQRCRCYEEIDNVPDRLRWCRHGRGLTQAQVAVIAGVTKGVYEDIESGVTQHVPATMMEKLASYYVRPVSDFMDEFSQFLLDGQARRISAYRQSLSMGRKAFSEYTGVPLSSLREWENGRKAISYKCWERYFKGRA